MKYLVLASAFLAVALAQNTSIKCSYPATGDETVENAVPIATFRTSGSDFVRPQWCISHCQDRKSIKAAMLFQPASPTSASYTVHRRRLMSGKIERDLKLIKGSQDDDPNFCLDDTVSATADAVFAKYTDIETISEALNYYINKPGWAYLVYQMGPPPSIIATENVHTDVNFCMKTPIVSNPDGSFTEYQMFAGLVQS